MPTPSNHSTRTDTLVAEDTCTFTVTRQLSRLIARQYDDAVRQFGITATQYVILRDLSRSKICASMLGQQYDIEKSTVSRNLKRLVSMGHVVIGPPTSRRGRELTITESGRAILQQALPSWTSADLKVCAALPGDTCSVIDTYIECLHDLGNEE